MCTVTDGSNKYKNFIVVVVLQQRLADYCPFKFVIDMKYYR